MNTCLTLLSGAVLATKLPRRTSEHELCTLSDTTLALFKLLEFKTLIPVNCIPFMRIKTWRSKRALSMITATGWDKI